MSSFGLSYLHEQMLGAFMHQTRRVLIYAFCCFSMIRFTSNHLNVALGDDTEDQPTRKKRILKASKGFAASAASPEFSSHATRGSRAFNEQQAFEPPLKPMLTGRNEVRIDQKETGFLPENVRPSSSTLVRSTVGVSIATSIWIVSTIHAFSRNARELINRKCGPGISVPGMYHERLLSTRASYCNAFSITPFNLALDRSLLQLLDWEKTIFDVEWLVSEEGVNWTFDWFVRMSTNPDNYIWFVPFEKPITWWSGLTTTFTAIHVKDMTRAPGTLGTAFLVPGHSYGTSINSVQMVDSFVTGQQLIDENGNPFNFSGVSLTFEDSLSPSVRYDYILQRVTGVIKNRTKDSGPKAPPSNGSSHDLTTPADTAPIGSDVKSPPAGKEEKGRGRKHGFISLTGKNVIIKMSHDAFNKLFWSLLSVSHGHGSYNSFRKAALTV